MNLMRGSQYHPSNCKRQIRTTFNSSEIMKTLFFLLPSTFSPIYYGQTANDYFEKGKSLELQLRIPKEIYCLAILLISFSGYGQQSYYNNGVTKQKLGDHKGAIADFTKAIEITDNDYMAYVNRGVSKDELGDYRGAISDYTKAIEVHPDYKAFENRGHSKGYLQPPDFKGAIPDFTRAIELSPNASEARYSYYFRGYAKIMLKQRDSGCLDLKKAAELGDEQAYKKIKEYCY